MKKAIPRGETSGDAKLLIGFRNEQFRFLPLAGSVFRFSISFVQLFVCSPVLLLHFFISSVHLFICSSVHLFICSSVLRFSPDRRGEA